MSGARPATSVPTVSTSLQGEMLWPHDSGTERTEPGPAWALIQPQG